MRWARILVLVGTVCICITNADESRFKAFKEEGETFKGEEEDLESFDDHLFDPFKSERHRSKRGLIGVEHEYFLQYFTDKGKRMEYLDAKRRGGGRMIKDWSGLGVSSYTDAVRQSTSYYNSQARQGADVTTQLNRVDEIIDGRQTRSNNLQRNSNTRLSDQRHDFTTQNWRNGRNQIAAGQRDYFNRCGTPNGRKKRAFRFRTRFSRFARLSRGNRRTGSRGWFISRRRGTSRRSRRLGC